ncbi:aldehyde dehydrogenase family protein [Castellaniella defragrans]|uniref:Aldehyde dehydrogenase n=2 Tax=Castellaniella defragrans TaxID=75697 RepID=W8X8A7_CASD6|nr:aldehyde dehydrogenase family protein [Castellaniella defragrans]KAB0619944.1 aldehyde dehydrogenase family protein [Castellaniella defragrans]MBB6084181.1 aldehyde dehydrogenase (NAD+) [Castellaniella defragrans]CDM22745.1 Aldehyde dehydrogenase [Castellaniella defragrans 65Phen]
MPAHHFIANARRPVPGERTLSVIDPADGREFDRIARGSAEDVDAAVRAAQAAMGEHFEGPWAMTCARDRGRLLAAWSRAVLDEAGELARLEARDTGKTLGTARNDVAALARYLEYYAGACDKLHGDTLPYDAGTLALTVREPHGVTGHIIPWNYPVQIFGRSVGASLAAGNACVVKPAEDASLSTLYLAEMAARVGFPAGALNVVTGLGAEAGAALSAHPGVRHISFTGSTATGRQVAEAAARHHCPVVLELGGKSPQIVFEDADLDAALPVVVNAIVQNSGQTCSAGSRLLVHESIHDAFVARVAERFRALRAGPPASDADLGPLVNQKQYERVRRMLDAARDEGLAEAARGRILDDAPPDGYYQEPVLFRDVPADSALAREEIFGPVLITQPFRDEAHALALANATDYGLVAGVWTRDGARQLRMARHLRCGQVFVNNYGAGGGVELPFGGVKSSGHGREKGFEALLGFTVLKTVAIRYGQDARN